MDVFRKIRDKFRTTKLPEDVNDGLESLEDYKSRWRSIHIIYYTMFLMTLGFSIILTGVWPYLKKLDPLAGKIFMGVIVAANPFAQMIFSPLFGWWSNKSSSIRLPLLTSLALFTIASAIYSLLELRPPDVKHWMLASRFLIGVSSANIAVCRSYLSAATRISERTKAVSLISLAQVLGFIIGPGLQTLVTPLGDDGVHWLNGIITINMYTACGWINVILSICNFLLFMPGVFQERKIAAREVMVLQGKTSEKETWKAIKPDYISAWTLIVGFFVLCFNFVLLETLGTVLTMEQFAWSNLTALYYMGILMLVGGVIALVTFICINPLCKMFEERYVLIWGGFFLMVLGRFLYLPWGSEPPKLAELYNVTIPSIVNGTEIDPQDEMFLGCPKTQAWCSSTNALTMSQFIIGYALTSVGYPIGITLLQTIFSKILGPRPQGVWMGLMTGSGCLSRVMGPVFVGTIYTEWGTTWTFGITGFMMLASMIWLLISNKRLVPPTYEKAKSIELLERFTENNPDSIDIDISPISKEYEEIKTDSVPPDDSDELLPINDKRIVQIVDSKE